MDQLIPSLAPLVAAFRACFRVEVFQIFQTLVAGGIVGLGPRTLGEVWQATGLAATRHHDIAYAVFHSAAWDWDDLGLVLATLILTHWIPSGVVGIAVDDTRGHKRGAKVAFGGLFLDAVLSSKRHKTPRFGRNWVVLGIAVPVLWRPDRSHGLPVLWRPDRKKGPPGDQARPQAAATLARKRAAAHPERTFGLVGDSAHVNAARLQRRPKPLQVIGPSHAKAALCDRPAPRGPKRNGPSRTKGNRLPNPKAMIADPATYPAELLTIAFPKPTRPLPVRVIRDVLGNRGRKTEPVTVVVARDPRGPWRDEALVATDPTVAAEFVLSGSCRRGSVELAVFDSKRFLGRHDPRVWSARSVARARPMAWFVGSRTVPW